MALLTAGTLVAITEADVSLATVVFVASVVFSAATLVVVAFAIVVTATTAVGLGFMVSMVDFGFCSLVCAMLLAKLLTVP